MKRLATLALVVSVVATLAVIKSENYLLFHSLAETVAIGVSAAVFLLALASRPFTDSDYVFVIGIALLNVALIDVLHLLAYRGMGIFPGTGANLATQLWIGARYILAAGLLAAPFHIDRKSHPLRVCAALGGTTALFLMSVFGWNIFPACFVEGTGLTPFKIGSEYVVCIMLALSALLTFRKRNRFDAKDLRLLLSFIGLTIAAETCFMFYKDPFGLANMTGHLLKTAGIVVMAVAILESGIRRPHTILFRNLAEREEALRKSEEALRAVKDELESRVEARTAELAESEHRFRTLVEDSPVGMVIVQDGRIVFRNPEQEKLFGPIPEGMELAGFRDIHTEDLGRFAELCESIPAGTGQKNPVDLRFFPRDKSSGRADMVWVQVRRMSIEYRGREATLLAMVDVSRFKEMEQVVLQQERMATLGLVAAGMAHEIRNPLSGLNIYLYSLEKILDESVTLEPENRKLAQQFAGMTKGASEKIEGVIRRVMDFSRPTVSRKTLCELNGCAREAVHLARVTLRHAGITITEALQEDLPVCYADPRLVEQVLLNLLSNAAQAMAETQQEKIIEIRSSLDDGHVTLSVSDSGPGIPPELREKVFEPFFTTRKEGNGIGLALSWKIVNDHGGTIQSGPGPLGGAEFRIRIPAGDLRSRERI